ncbi:hypothetical protein SALBM217S_05305 [Streptomyces griseoloalbus]
MSSGVKPNTSSPYAASARDRAPGVGYVRAQGAGSGLTGTALPPEPSSKVTGCRSSDPKCRARCWTRAGAVHSAASARGVSVTVVPGAGRAEAGRVRTV